MMKGGVFFNVWFLDLSKRKKSGDLNDILYLIIE